MKTYSLGGQDASSSYFPPTIVHYRFAAHLRPPGAPCLLFMLGVMCVAQHDAP